MFLLKRELSKNQAERQRQATCPHCLSRKGYVGLEAEIVIPYYKSFFVLFFFQFFKNKIVFLLFV